MFKASAHMASMNVSLAKANHMTNFNIKGVGKCSPSTLVGGSTVSLGKGMNMYVDDKDEINSRSRSPNHHENLYLFITPLF